ncbi:MAG: hypothetical protein ACI8TX_003642 [Hyphomicrobiaceae bacterium]|jgi:hypothetical protein
MSLISRFFAHRATTTLMIVSCAFFVLTGYSEKGSSGCEDSDNYFADHEVDPGEQCDDGNLVDGDGCSADLGKQECSANVDCLSLALIPDEFTPPADTSENQYNVAKETEHALAALRGTTCVTGVCDHAACTTNTDCAAFPNTACKTYDLQLAKELKSTVYWPDDRFGKLYCQDSGCANNADCAGGTICSGSVCEPGCAKDTECSPTEICEADLCEQGCRNDTACRLTGGDSLICRTVMDTDAGSCVAGCRLAEDCEAGERCSADHECEEDIDCTTNADCVDSEWGSSPTCNGGSCVPDCTTNADCGPEMLCTALTCGAACVDDDGCDSGRICETGACQEGCRATEECPFGSTCTGNVCEEPVLPSTEPRLCGPEVGSRCLFPMNTGKSGGNLGGLAGADALCQARGDASPIAGMAGRTWQALLADSSQGPDDRWIEQSSVPYVMLDGTQLAADYAGLMSGDLATMPDIGSDGLDAETFFIWSGTHNGAASAGAASDFNCNGWTSADPGDGAMYGFSDQNSITFIAVLGGASTPIPGEPELGGFEELACDFGTGSGGGGIYCVEMLKQP